jgi:hypothetical protein
VKLLKHFYKYQKDNESKKINLLFDLAILSRTAKRKEELDRKTVKRIYGSNNRKNEALLGKLKCRLKNDILNILLMQNSSQKFKAKHDAAIFECRKMLLQGEILMGRGIYDDGICLLEKASIIASKNELFAEQILIDELCRNYNLSRADEAAFSGFMQRIGKNTSLFEKAQYAKRFHYEMMSSKLFKTSSIQPIEEWEEKLNAIRQDYEKTGSVKVGYYYHLSALNFYREVHMYDRSLEFGLKLLESSKSEDILKTPFYSGKINMELAKCYLLTENYEKTVVHANASNDFFQNDLINELTTLEILLHCHFMKQDHSQMSSVVERAFEKIDIGSDEFNYSKWCFLKAGVQFRKHEYSTAMQTLKDCTGLLKDKNGWVLAYSLFEVICKIENGNLEWFEYRYEALKKIITRYNKGYSGQNKRFNLVFRILKTLHKNNYDYVQTVSDEKENVTRLSETSHSYSWHMSGYEPVQFDLWLKEKAAKQLKERKAKSKLVA